MEEVNSETVEVHCFCKKKYEGEFMVNCKKCLGWYHPKCMKYYCFDCRELVLKEKDEAIQERTVELAFQKSEYKVQSLKVKELEEKLEKAEKIIERLKKENSRLQEKDNKNKAERQKRDKNIEEKVKKLCKTKEDELQKTLKQVAELLNSEQKNSNIIENLKEDLSMKSRENSERIKEGERLSMELLEKGKTLSELQEKENICKTVTECLKRIENSIENMKSKDSNDGEGEAQDSQEIFQSSLRIRESVEHLIDSDEQSKKSLDQIEELKKDFNKKKGEVRKLQREQECYNAEKVKNASERQKLEVQHQQLSESWALLKQINKDLELQLQGNKENTSREPGKAPNIVHGDDGGKGRKNPVKNESKMKLTKVGYERSNDLTIKIMAKKENESGEGSWRERDINIGTVDEPYEKQPTQLMMIIEEDVCRNTSNSSLKYGKKRNLCKYFLNGNCRFGKDCWYLHEQPDSRNRDKIAKEDHCRRDGKEKYRHEEPWRKQNRSHKYRHEEPWRKQNRSHSSRNGGEKRGENRSFLWKSPHKFKRRRKMGEIEEKGTRKDELSQ